MSSSHLISHRPREAVAPSDASTRTGYGPYSSLMVSPFTEGFPGGRPPAGENPPGGESEAGRRPSGTLLDPAGRQDGRLGRPRNRPARAAASWTTASGRPGEAVGGWRRAGTARLPPAGDRRPAVVVA